MLVETKKNCGPLATHKNFCGLLKFQYMKKHKGSQVLESFDNIWLSTSISDSDAKKNYIIGIKTIVFYKLHYVKSSMYIYA